MILGLVSEQGFLFCGHELDGVAESVLHDQGECCLYLFIEDRAVVLVLGGGFAGRLSF